MSEPDHIVALRAVAADRAAEALAVPMDTPAFTDAWLRFAVAERAVNEALAVAMRRRALPERAR